MDRRDSPSFHWVLGEQGPLRKKLKEAFLPQSRELNLTFSQSWDQVESKLQEKPPSFWIFSSGKEPPQWVVETGAPIIQFFWNNFPSNAVKETAAGLITPYVPKPNSFNELMEIFRVSLRLWAHPALYPVQSMKTKPRLVILEDDESLQFLLEEALKKIAIGYEVIFFESGSEALDGLKKMSEEENLPLFLFLDLYLRGMDGSEVLKAIKGNDSLRSIPVALFTGTQDPKELRFMKGLPRHFCFRLPLLECDAIDLIGRCLAFFRYAHNIPV